MNANLLICVTGNGLARAECGANGAWNVETPITGQDIRCLAADPRHHHLLYAGTQGQGALRSQDAGKTWHPAGLAGRIVKSIAVSAFPGGTVTGPGMIFAGTKSPPSVFMSTDGGEIWMELEAFRRIRSRWFWFSPAERPFTAYVQGIAISPADPNMLIAGIEAGAVVRAENCMTTSARS
jgi:hypothetical protein